MCYPKNMKGKLFILSGQSGVGKKLILEKVREHQPALTRIASYTTREQRLNEIPGEDHYFVYREKFEEMIKNGELMEHAVVHNQLFGYPKKPIDDALAAGKNVLIEMDVQGVTNIWDKYNPVTIFIKYNTPQDGDLETLVRNRIKNDPGRGEVPEAEILERIATAKREITYEKNYKYSIINPEGHPEVATREVENIIKKELAN